MPTVERDTFPDEPATRPIDNIPTRTIALAARTARLVAIALQRLREEGDVEGACEALDQLAALAKVAA